MAYSRFVASLCFLLLGLRSSANGRENDDVDFKAGKETLKRHLLVKSNVSIANIYINPQNGDLIYTEVVSSHTGTYKLNVLESGATDSKQIVGYKGKPRAITADSKNKLIYIGTSKGIYTLPIGYSEAELFAEEGNDIRYVLFANHDLYIVPFKESIPFKYVNGVPTREDIKPPIDFVDNRLAVDTEGNIYHVASSQRLMKQSNEGSSVRIKFGNKGDFVYALTVDSNDRLLISSDDAIYALDKGETEAKLLLTVRDEVSSLYTDNGLAIYTLEGKKIYKYQKS